jgi:hypothetical protein
MINITKRGWQHILKHHTAKQSLTSTSEDYFEEVDFAPATLPALSEELGIIRKAVPSADIAKFLVDLDGLISLAARRKQLLTAVPD